jgi:serine/threonine protein kinase
MATVHRAIERGIEGFERVVALKRLLPHLAEDEGFVRAFVREAKLASLLQHGNIVQLYELGRVGASYFISMEYIPGRDLRVVLRQARRVCGPPPVEIALAVLTELLDALDYAHSLVGGDGKPLGLVHRDISPSNLIVSHTGHLKVIDFGIAKATLGHMMTHTGRIKGKLSYMAPEALTGRSLDGRSDLFSASVIAHELLTATPLFAAKDDFQTIDKLQNMQPPPPSAKNPACPPGLDEIVLRGLAKDPARRWRSASEMRAALAEFAIDQHRLATNREVCEWVEEAFEMPLPSRMRLPANPAEMPGSERRRSLAAIEADDEIMDIVWGVTGPRSPAQVVLDEVPDVSSRFSRTAPEAVSGPVEERDDSGLFDPMDPLEPLSDEFEQVLALAGEDEPTNAMVRPSLDPVPRAEVSAAPAAQPRATRPSRSQVISLASVGAVTETGQRRGSHDRVGIPAEWAVGTSPTPPDPIEPGEHLLEHAVEAARRASVSMPLASTTLSTTPKRPSVMPLLVASVVVAAAGAGVAWMVSGGQPDAPAQVAAVPSTQAQVQPLSQGQGALAPPVEPPAGSDEAVVAPGDPQPSEAAGAVDEQVSSDARRRRTRSRRDVRPERGRSAIAADETEDEVDTGEPSEPENSGDSDDSDAVASAEPPSEVETAPPALDAAPLGADQRGQLPSAKPPRPSGAPPATGAVKTPATREVAAAPRRRAPIIVPPYRMRREAGTMPPIRFPRWEDAPSQLTAKLCIDENGKVTSVKVMSRVSEGVRTTLERALATWQYRPVMEGNQKVPACFASTFKIEMRK